MKVTCPKCQHAARIDPGRIPAAGATVRCPTCSARFRVSPPVPAVTAVPAPIPAVPAPTPTAPPPTEETLVVLCPACRHEQLLTPGCRRCGVIFARYRPRPVGRVAPPPPPPRKAASLLLLWLGLPLVVALTLFFVPRFFPAMAFLPAQTIVLSSPAPSSAMHKGAAAQESPLLSPVFFERIATGLEHAAAIDRHGMVWTWGENNSGQLASCLTGSANRPQPVKDKAGQQFGPVVQVAAGVLYTLAVKADGTVWIWGLKPGATPYENMSRSGRKGIWYGGPHNAIRPTLIEGIDDAVAVTVWEGVRPVFIVLHADGTLSLFGDSSDSLPLLQPRRLPGLTEIAAISAGRREVALLRRDGTVWTWKGSELTSLSSDPFKPGPPLHRIESLQNVVKVVAGGVATLALKENGTVWGWGENLNAQLPSGLIIRDPQEPAQIPGLADIVEVAVPGYGYSNAGHYLALDRQGRVWSWGYNQKGQLGRGESEWDHIEKAAPIEGLDHITAIAAGGMFSLALRSDGTLWSWGTNSSGQIGDGTGDNQTLPARVLQPGVDGEEER